MQTALKIKKNGKNLNRGTNNSSKTSAVCKTANQIVRTQFTEACI